MDVKKGQQEAERYPNILLFILGTTGAPLTSYVLRLTPPFIFLPVFIQPADIGLNKPFKSTMRSYFAAWASNIVQQQMLGGVDPSNAVMSLSVSLCRMCMSLSNEHMLDAGCA